jgi:hypothetical protein
MTLTVLIGETQTPAPPPAPLIALLFPWLFLGLIMGSVLATMAKRKGKNPLLWFFLGFIPVVGFFLAFVLASRPDVALLDRIRRLEERLGSDSVNSTRVLPPPI